jgi:hypothetical protein
MLLIDGVKHEEWTPPSEDEFERVVKEHTQDIFGEQSIYLDRKQKLRSLSGIGSIPDGYAIILGDSPHWHIVEVELSSHPLHDHIISQVGRFISGISNPNIQRGIVNAIDEDIAKDDFIKLRLRKAIEPAEIYRFLTDLISKPPILTIIIEKDTEELREALNTLRYPQIKVVEFQTFTRERVGLEVHAHLFKPLDSVLPSPKKPEKVTETRPPVISVGKSRKQKRITIPNLIGATLIQPGQTIYGLHKGNKYEARIMPDGKIKLLHDGREFNSLSLAAFKGIVGHEVNGWNWWHITDEDGRDCKLDELRKEYESIST